MRKPHGGASRHRPAGTSLRGGKPSHDRKPGSTLNQRRHDDQVSRVTNLMAQADLGRGQTAPSHAINGTSVVIPAMMADVEEVEVVVAHHERATLRVGDVFLKIDADQTRTDVEAWWAPSTHLGSECCLARLGWRRSASPRPWRSRWECLRRVPNAFEPFGRIKGSVSRSRRLATPCGHIRRTR